MGLLRRRSNAFFAVVLLLVAALILYGGYQLELTYGHYWFQRSGAFLTVFSVVLLLSSIRADERARRAEWYQNFITKIASSGVETAESYLERHRGGEKFQTLELATLEKSFLDALAFERFALNVAQKSRREQEDAEKNATLFSRLSYFALLVGTVVWAVGDLFTGCFLRLESASC